MSRCMLPLEGNQSWTWCHTCPWATSCQRSLFLTWSMNLFFLKPFGQCSCTAEHSYYSFLLFVSFHVLYFVERYKKVPCTIASINFYTDPFWKRRDQIRFWKNQFIQQLIPHKIKACNNNRFGTSQYVLTFKHCYLHIVFLSSELSVFVCSLSCMYFHFLLWMVNARTFLV